MAIQIPCHRPGGLAVLQAPAGFGLLRLHQFGLRGLIRSTARKISAAWKTTQRNGTELTGHDKSHPQQNWASHGADALQTSVCGFVPDYVPPPSERYYLKPKQCMSSIGLNRDIRLGAAASNCWGCHRVFVRVRSRVSVSRSGGWRSRQRRSAIVVIGILLWRLPGR
jgi:hypothetical protein